MAEKNGTTKRILIGIIIAMTTTLLGYSVIFIRYNYAEDEKRDTKIEEVQRSLVKCKEVDATQTANIAAIKEQIKKQIKNAILTTKLLFIGAFFMANLKGEKTMNKIRPIPIVLGTAGLIAAGATEYSGNG